MSAQEEARKIALLMHGYKDENGLRYWGNMCDEGTVAKTTDIIATALLARDEEIARLEARATAAEAALARAREDAEQARQIFSTMAYAPQTDRPFDALEANRIFALRGIAALQPKPEDKP